jgi:peptidoglycan/LPS O-acetylase OafA/YrhL
VSNIVTTRLNPPPIADRSELRALTGLRFFAALAISNAHLGWFATLPIWGHAVPTSAIGMPLFFTLSGFIIHYVYGERFNQAAWPASCCTFVFARFSRLYPLFLFMAAFSYLFEGLNSTVVRHAGIAISYMTLTGTWWYWQIDGHGYASLPFGISWSIPTECFFYVCYALALYRIGRIRSLVSSIAMLFGIAVFSYLAIYWIFLHRFTAVQDLLLAIFPDALTRDQSQTENVVEWFVYTSPYLHILEFVSGVLVCQIFILARKAPRVRTEMIFWIGIVVLAILFVTFCYVSYDWIEWLGFLHFLHRSYLFVPAICAIILASALGNCSASRLLGTSALVALGEASYSLYLCHSWAWVITHVDPIARFPFVRLTFMLVIACAIAVGMFKVVERPAKQMLRRNADKWPYCSRHDGHLP